MELIMKSVFYYFLALISVGIFTSCKDSTVEPESGIYKVKFIDAATKNPIANASVNVYYGIEPVTPNAGIIEDVNDDELDTTLAVYPNPFKSHLIFTFVIKENANIKAEICDINGNHLYTNQELYYQAGIHTVVISTENWSAAEPSFYYLKLYKGGNFYQQSIALHTPKWFSNGQSEEATSTPFKTIQTNESGIIELNKSSFPLIGNLSFSKTDETGKTFGNYKVLNGCYCFIHYGTNNEVTFNTQVNFSNSKDITIEVSK